MLTTTKPGILQEDNDPKHTSNLAKSWKSSENVLRLDWPAMSPLDLNPIEHVWGLMKAHIEQKPIMSSDSLIYHLNKIWDGLSAEYATNLAKSCQRRMEAVIAANGDYIMF